MCIFWRRKWQTTSLSTPVSLPGEFHGQGSLVGYSPWGRKELDTTERLTHTHTHTCIFRAVQVALVVKNWPISAGDIREAGSISGSGRSPGGGHGNALQYSCLEDPMDRGAWRVTVHGIAKESDTTKQQQQYGAPGMLCSARSYCPLPGWGL